MRTRKLLASAALLTGALGSSCKNESSSLPGNPKGSFYAGEAGAAALPGNPKGSMYDAGVGPVAPLPEVKGAQAAAQPADASPDASARPASHDAGHPVRHGLPGNPKGSHHYGDDPVK